MQSLGWKALLLFAAALTTVSGQENDTCVSIAEVAETSGLTTLVTAIDALDGDDLGDIISADEPPEVPITLFAPNDAAFQALGELPDDETTAEILATHAYPAMDLSSADILQQLSASGGVLFLETGNEQFIQVTTGSDGLSFQLSVSGGPPGTPPATVVQENVPACGGVVHVIDQVLTPAPCDTLVDALAKHPDTATLLQYINEYVSDETIQELMAEDAEFTILAPTNEAFTLLEEAIAASGDVNITSMMEDIILQHVIAGEFAAEDLADGEELTSLLPDSPVTVTIAGEAVSFSVGTDSASVIKVDQSSCIDTSDLHIIDKVLLPATVELGVAIAPAEGPVGLPGIGDAPGEAPLGGIREIPGEEDGVAGMGWAAVLAASLLATLLV